MRLPPDARLSDDQLLEEFIANGALLGFLLDPIGRTVYVYRPGQAPEFLQQPKAISADPILPGFNLQLAEIWEPRW